VSGLATYVAAVGGGFLALNFQSSLPDSFNPFIGLIWLAVLVSVGSRSITAALVAGLVFALLPGVFQTYLPAGWTHLPTILFGLGAIMLARNPEGVIAMHARQLADLTRKRSDRRGRSEPGRGEATGRDVSAEETTAQTAERVASGGNA
jgi:branched-chain amino acid transport system permease protein